MDSLNGYMKSFSSSNWTEDDYRQHEPSLHELADEGLVLLENIKTTEQIENFIGFYGAFGFIHGDLYQRI